MLHLQAHVRAAPAPRRPAPLPRARAISLRGGARRRALPDAPQGDPDEDDGDGLSPEEDFEVPGTYEDAMKAGTQLGRAVRAACDEIDALAALEREVLAESEGLLQRLGFKGSLFAGPPPGELEEEGLEEEEGDDS